jgi:phosphatidylcholine synthase
VRLLAFLVHVLTATGAALALLALIAATHRDWPLMFVWLGLAFAVDALDGPLARAIDIKTRLPRWSGDVLDLVVDYTTYVFVPAYAIAMGGLLPDALAIPAAVAVTVSGTLYFGDGLMKTADHFFRGFPALWNLAVFYLLLLRPSAPIAAISIGLLVVLSFVPLRFVHPFRVRRWRAVTVALLTLWAVLALDAVRQRFEPAPWITAALCLIVPYFFLIGLVPERRVPR